MDPQRLLEQFLGKGGGRNTGGDQKSGGDSLLGGFGGMTGGLAAGGLAGLLLGNKKARKTLGKVAGGAVGYGGAAALGALAYRAYQNWQSGNKPAETASQPAPASEPPADSRFLPQNAPAGDGRPFELALVIAMIGAANADGHIGPEEQRAIFDQVGKLPLDAEDKALVFDTLSSPPSLRDVAALAQGPEQASELWLASRLAIDPDHPAEHAYLEALANRLSLPNDLVEQLESQVQEAERA